MAEANQSTATELGEVMKRYKRASAEQEQAAERARAEGERADRETRRLLRLARVAPVAALDGVVSTVLEAAAELSSAGAAILVLQQGDEKPTVAAAGLSDAEADADLLALPADGGHTRAALIEYRYTDDELDTDAFRLRSAIVVPLRGLAGDRIGTLAVFTRRKREIAEAELACVEELAFAFGPALANALAYDAVRDLADTDPVTRLHDRRYFEEALERECALARRHDRRLSLLVVQLGADVDARAAADGVRSAVRRTDLACRLDEDELAVILPEAAASGADLVARRLNTRLGDPVELRPAVVELRPEEGWATLLRRAETGLVEPEPARSTV